MTVFFALLDFGACFELGIGAGELSEEPGHFGESAEEPGHFGNSAGWESYDLQICNRESNNGNFAMFAVSRVAAAYFLPSKDAISQTTTKIMISMMSTTSLH
mmetsp:Transcript_10445/g.20145  ORF Transcript_10445/g.20145 Transcript_10445/m.20145 type:complete len:102 (+) Transcript_10445:1760-2065(+)